VFRQDEKAEAAFANNVALTECGETDRSLR
jgi:hypothetical protein